LSKNSVKTDVEITYYLVIVIVNKIAIIGNPFVSLLSLDLSHHNKQEYVNLIPTSLFFYKSYNFCWRSSSKKIFQITHSVIILVNRTTTIGNPYTITLYNWTYLMITTQNIWIQYLSAYLSFQNIGFRQKNKKKSDGTIRNPYVVVVSVNKIITFRSPYTKYELLNIVCATKLRCVIQINVSFFNEP
jgi:hypothetical protein